MQIVAAFTGGDSDNLMVGRNGIFFDRKGRDWDATITKIIDNPISIRQAFFAPYKKLVRMIEEQVAKRAAAADAAADAKLAAAAKATASGEAPKPVEPPKQKIDTGTLAAIGLVLTTLLAALGGIFGKILGLVWWQIPLAFIAILLAISAPSMIIAWLKLRRRNLGPILDANGWAVNAKAKMNVPFGGALTGVAALPPGSQRDLVDPFAEKKSPWPKVIVVLILLIVACVVLNKMGYIYDWTNGRIGTPKPVRVEKVPAGASGSDRGSRPSRPRPQSNTLAGDEPKQTNTQFYENDEATLVRIRVRRGPSGREFPQRRRHQDLSGHRPGPRSYPDHHYGAEGQRQMGTRSQQQDQNQGRPQGRRQGDHLLHDGRYGSRSEGSEDQEVGPLNRRRPSGDSLHSWPQK